MLRKIEGFLRGELYLHIATMFLCMVILLQLLPLSGNSLPLWILLLIPIAVGLLWELSWKWYNQKPIVISDIIGTMIGGYLAIVILKL